MTAKLVTEYEFQLAVTKVMIQIILFFSGAESAYFISRLIH